MGARSAGMAVRDVYKRQHLSNHVINAAVVNLAGVEHRKAIVFVELGADPDLYGVVRIDKPVVRRGIEHGAVVELAAVGVGIGVSIEVHQRDVYKRQVLNSYHKIS